MIHPSDGQTDGWTGDSICTLYSIYAVARKNYFAARENINS